MSQTAKKSNKVTIFSNGMADFRRVFKGTGKQQRVELPVKQDHIGDILASLIIDGKVKLVVPPSFTPQNELQGKLELNGDDVFQDIARKLRGADVEIERSGEPLKGRIFGLDSEKRSTGGEAIDIYFLQVLTPSGLERVSQDQIKRIKFTQESVQSEVDKALQREFQKIKPGSTTVALELTSEQENGEFSLHYTIPAAAWKMTYRLRNTGAGVLFDGVCVVDNNTEEDWNDFLIAVVTGEPITFSTDVATSKSPRRSMVNLVSENAQGAVEVERGYNVAAKSARSRGGVMRAMACSAPMGGGAESVTMDYMESDQGLESMGGGLPGMAADADVREVGDFSIFEINTPLTIKAGQSAEIPIFNAALKDAESVLFYKPEDNPERPFRAIKFKNETGQNLGRGVCTVYEQGTYGGSAVLQATKQGESALLCHAVETGVKVRKTQSGATSDFVAVKIADSIAVSTTEYNQQTEYRIKNIKAEEFTLVLDHKNTWQGGRLVALVGDSKIEPSESLKNGFRYTLKVAANSELVLGLSEHFTQDQQITISSHWINNMFINTEHDLLSDPGIKRIVELQEGIATLGEQIAELNQKVQIATNEQNRVSKLIEKDATNDQWRADLRKTEEEIRKITREELPALQKGLNKQNTELNKALKALACEWKKSDKPTKAKKK